MFILRVMMSPQPITNLSDTALGSQASFTSAHFLPHGHDSLGEMVEIQQAKAVREIQQILDEAQSKVARVSTKTIVTSIIRSMDVVVGGCANTTVLLSTLVDFDATSVEDTKVPFLHYAARRLAIMLTSKEYVAYGKKHACNAKLYYSAFALFNRVQVALFKVITDEASISAANQNNGSANVKSINTAPFKMAKAILDRGLTTLFAVLSESEVLEETVVFQNSIFSDEHKALVAAQVKKRGVPLQDVDVPLTKRQKQSLKPTPSAGTARKNVGAIDSLSSDMITMPKTYPEGEIALCPAALRNKSKGCANPKCSRSHDGPDKWSPAMTSCMIAHVKADDNLAWNPQVMTPEMLKLKHSKTPVKEG